MHVWPLPYVEAGGIREMCLNHEPRLLIGKDSVAGSVWQSNRGNWFLNGQVLPEHYFRADNTGNFKIFYRYADAHQCVNTDSTVMIVHALPDTVFKSRPQYCRGVQAEFIVDKGAEEWRYSGSIIPEPVGILCRGMENLYMNRRAITMSA